MAKNGTLNAAESRLSAVHRQHIQRFSQVQYPLGMSAAKKMAQSILQSMQSAYYTPDVFVRAKEKDFPHLDFAQYQRAKIELLKLGFRHLADVQVKNVSDDPNAVFRPSLIRCMRSQRGDAVATIYQVRRTGKWVWLHSRELLIRRHWIKAVVMIASMWQSKLIVGIESELSDGTFITTTNWGVSTGFEWENVIDDQSFSEGTKPSILFHSHVARLSRSRRARALKPVALNGERDYLDMQARMKVAKLACREKAGWVSCTELVSMAGGDLELGHEVYREIQAILGARV